jgi:hypothetical protein
MRWWSSARRPRLASIWFVPSHTPPRFASRNAAGSAKICRVILPIALVGRGDSQSLLHSPMQWPHLAPEHRAALGEAAGGRALFSRAGRSPRARRREREEGTGGGHFARTVWIHSRVLVMGWCPFPFAQALDWLRFILSLYQKVDGCMKVAELTRGPTASPTLSCRPRTEPCSHATAAATEYIDRSAVKARELGWGGAGCQRRPRAVGAEAQKVTRASRR